MPDGVIAHLDWTDCAHCAREYNNQCTLQADSGRVEVEVNSLSGYRDGAKAQQDVAALLADRRALKARLKHLEAEVRIAALSRGYVEPHVWEWGGYTYIYDGWRVTVRPRIGGRILVDHECTAAFEAGRRYQRERGDE